MADSKELKKLEILLYDGNDEEKENALKKLLDINTIESHDIIKNALREGNEELKYFIKKKFSSIIQKDNYKETISKTVKESNKQINLKNLQKYLSNHDPRKRLRAVEVASEHQDIRALPMLIELAENEDDDFVKATLAKNLGFFKDKSVIPVIAKFLNDGDSRVRANAVEGLEITGGEEIIEFLTPMLRDSNNRVQANAAKTLAKFEIGEVLDVLEKMIKSHAIWQRESALYALKELKNPATIPFLVEIIENDNDNEIKLTALKTLIAFSPSIVKEKMKNLLKNSKISSNQELKKIINEYLNIGKNTDIETEESLTPIPAGNSNLLKISLAFVFILIAGFISYGIYSFMNFSLPENTAITEKIVENPIEKPTVPTVENTIVDEPISNQILEPVIELDNVIPEVIESKKEHKEDTVDLNKNAIIQNSLNNKLTEENKPEQFNPEQVTSEQNKNQSEIQHQEKLYSENIKEPEPVDNNNQNNVTSDEPITISQEISPTLVTEEIVTIPDENPNRLEQMLSEIEALRKDNQSGITQVSNLREKVEEQEQVRDIQAQVSSYKKELRKRVVIIPAQINGKNDRNVIFSNGLLYSYFHVLESLGSNIEFIDPADTINKINEMGINIDNFKNNSMLKNMLKDHFRADYFMFVSFREVGSRFTEYWNQFIISNSEAKADMEVENSTFLMAKLDPEVDIGSSNFFDDTSLESREVLIVPFFNRGIEYLRKQQYEQALYEFKIAHTIAPDSHRYNTRQYLDESREKFLIAMNTTEQSLLRNIRFSVSIELQDSIWNSVLTKTYNTTAEDFWIVFQDGFNDLKSYLKSNGHVYSDFRVVNGHSKNFKSVMFFYRAVEYYFNINTRMEGGNTSLNPRERNRIVNQELDRALNLSREFSLPFILKSHVLLRENNQFEALSNMRQALEVDPGRLSLKYRLAMLEENAGRTDNALRIYNEIADYDKDTVFRQIQSEASLKVAIDLFKKEKYAEVISKCDFSLKFMHSSSVHFLKALSLHKLSRNSDAERELRILRQMVSNDIYINTLYSYVMYSLNSRQQALDLMKNIVENFSALNSSPVHQLGVFEIKREELFFNIGEIYRSIPNNNLAISYYKQAVSTAPYSETANKARRILTEMNAL